MALLRAAHAVRAAFPTLAGSAAHARAYNVDKPIPSLNKDDVYALTTGKNARDRIAKPNRVGHRMSRVEADDNALASRRGYVAATNFTGASVFNTYYKYCWAVRRPYVAVDRHGTSVYVDATPVTSLSKAPDAARLAKSLAALSSAITAPQLPTDAQLQVVTRASLQKQYGLAMPGPGEGSSAQKVADTSVADVFTVYTGSRDQARRLADAMHAAHCTAFGLPLPAQVAEAKAERAEAKRERGRAMMVKRLRALVADDVAVKNLRVAAGAVDGFIEQEKRGAVV